MCSIVMGLNPEKVKELVELNKYRGVLSHSITEYDKDEKDIWAVYRSAGELDTSLLNSSLLEDGFEYMFQIIHQQAPTTDNRSKSYIHPCEYKNNFLWHNGIIKEKEIKALQKLYHLDTSWDTELLLHHILASPNYTPDAIDGSFACVFINDKGHIFVFRNEIAPLFHTDTEFSSTQFDGSQSLEANIVFRVIIKDGKFELTPAANFKTHNNPYYM